MILMAVAQFVYLNQVGTERSLRLQYVPLSVETRIKFKENNEMMVTMRMMRVACQTDLVN